VLVIWHPKEVFVFEGRIGAKRVANMGKVDLDFLKEELLVGVTLTDGPVADPNPPFSRQPLAARF
jgi:hypothetical protein